MTQHYGIDCPNCNNQLIFHDRHKEDWICYFCQYNIEDYLQKQEENMNKEDKDNVI